MGRGEDYAAGICRQMFKGLALADASEKQVWKIYFALVYQAKRNADCGRRNADCGLGSAETTSPQPSPPSDGGEGEIGGSAVASPHQGRGLNGGSAGASPHPACMVRWKGYPVSFHYVEGKRVCSVAVTDKEVTWFASHAAALKTAWGHGMKAEDVTVTMEGEARISRIGTDGKTTSPRPSPPSDGGEGVGDVPLSDSARFHPHPSPLPQRERERGTPSPWLEDANRQSPIPKQKTTPTHHD
jgi:hypothetical protein